MSLLVRPMNQPDELDPLLRRFFQSEMPSPWPTCPTPAQPARVMVPEKPAASWLELSQRFASRFALALSLVLFLGVAWGLSEMFKAPTTQPNRTPALVGQPIEFGAGTAEHKKATQPKDGVKPLPEFPEMLPNP